MRASESNSETDDRTDVGLFEAAFPMLAILAFLLGVIATFLVAIHLPPWALWAWGTVCALGVPAIYFGKIRGK